MVQFYGPSAVNNPFYMAAIEANNPLLSLNNRFSPGARYMEQYGFQPTVPVTIPPAQQTAAPPPPPPEPLVNIAPRVSMRRPDLGYPTEAPSFTPTYSYGLPGYEAVDHATSSGLLGEKDMMSTYGVEDFGAVGGANREEAIASLAQQNAMYSYDQANPSAVSTLSKTFDQPISTTVNNFLDAQFNQPANLVGAVTGSTIMSQIAKEMGRMNVGNLAYDRAMEMQGVPGYSTGSIDGQMFSISPTSYGAQVMSGVVPDWFDIDTAERMSAVNAGLDPESGTGLSGFTPGVGGYNAQGNFVDAFGNISAMGSMSNLQSLANSDFGGSTTRAREALLRARQGIQPLIRIKRRGIFEELPDISGDIDPNSIPDYDITADPLSGMDQSLSNSLSAALSFSAEESLSGEEGIGGFGVGDAESGAGGGLGY